MAEKAPYFSVVIPAYNREVLIKKAVDSVLAQTYTNFEVIVVDDASKDKTADTVASYTDPRVKLIRQPVNGERGVARNTGVAAAKGAYICFLDSDDWWEPNHLENFYQHLQKLNYPKALLFSNIYLSNGSGSKTERPQQPYTGNDIYNYLLRFTFNPTRVCVHVDIVRELTFDTTIPGLEDLDLWLRIATKYPLIQLHEYTCGYLEHDGSYTSGDEKRFEKELQNFKSIFAKPELKNLLPQLAKSYLLSKCYYHLAITAEKRGAIAQMYPLIVKAYYNYPNGYNKNANKAMATMFLYHIPVLGWVIKKTVRSFK